TRRQKEEVNRRELRGSPEDFAQPFDDALHIEEIDVGHAALPMFRSGSGPCKTYSPRLAMRRKARPDFKQTDAPSAVTAIMGDHVHQSWQQRWPQRVEHRRQGVGDRDHAALFGPE